jgi:VWFA-related protein
VKSLLGAVLAILPLCATFGGELNDKLPPGPVYKADVNMVALTFTVTDKKGNSVTGLKSSDLVIREDGIEQKITALAEGRQLFRAGSQGDESAGVSVFILFDTSNRMYSGFPHACDAIAGFIRLLPPGDSAALYTFSRNLFRSATLSPDHALTRAGLRNLSAGDDTALFNSILLTARDAAVVAGRKAIVVFSNGPDTASVIGPDDVGRVAEDEGIPIYIISTRDQAQDHPLNQALKTLTSRTGGKLYAAQNWEKQVNALADIRADIGSAYTAYYYPEPNPNQGFRVLTIEIISRTTGTYQIRSRRGYQAKRRSN